jgi:hypothetical protein
MRSALSAMRLIQTKNAGELYAPVPRLPLIIQTPLLIAANFTGR